MPANLYKRNGVWWGRFQVAGTDHRRSLRTRDRAEAKERLEKLRRDLSHLAYYGENRMTYKAAVTQWAAEYLPSLKPATAARYKVSARQLDPHLSSLYIDQIDRKTISRYIRARKEQSATNATIRRDLTALSRIMSCCVAWGYRDDNPAQQFDRSIIRERRDPVRYVQDDEVSRLVKACPPGLARMVRLLEQTGMREEEAASLEWSQVNLARAEILLTKTKTNTPRVVPLSEAAVGTISGTPRSLSSPYVFWHGAGSRYRNVSSRLAAIKAKQELRFRIHDLRHKFAIDWLRQHRDIYRLSKILGHSSVKTTEIYLAFIDEGSAQKPAHVQRSEGSS
jgi:integrase